MSEAEVTAQPAVLLGVRGRARLVVLIGTIDNTDDGC
jgi:hypothetical protein